jgi:HK97 family phage major capsid protein
MSNKLSALKSEREAAVAEMEQIPAVAEAEMRPVTEEEQKRFDELDTKCEELGRQIKSEEALLKRKAEVEAGKEQVSAGRIVSPSQPMGSNSKVTTTKAVTIPATVKRWGNLTSFRGPAADVQAYKAGQFYLACLGSEKAQAWLDDHGISAALHQESVNTRGGYLVYDELDNAIIDLRDTYGVFAVNARRVAMASDTVRRPRRTGGLTVYFIGEGSAGTESNKTWDQVTLTAKKAAVLARISNDLAEDAIINIADDLTSEIAWAFAKKIDECGFVGDGTATYGGMTGINTKLKDINGVDDGGGICKSANNTYAEITLAETTKCISLLPAYATSRAKWYMSNTVWGQSFLPLLTAGSGNAIVDLQTGARQLMYMGYPVQLSAAFPSTAANSQVIAIFGDLALSSDFGDRRQTTVRMSEAAVIDSTSTFEQDETGLIATTRFDINNHDLGTASAAGPVVGLMLHSA